MWPGQRAIITTMAGQQVQVDAQGQFSMLQRGVNSTVSAGRKLLDGLVVDNQNVNDQIVNNLVVNDQTVNNQIVNNQIVDNQNVNNQVVNNQIVTGNWIGTNQIVINLVGINTFNAVYTFNSITPGTTINLVGINSGTIVINPTMTSTIQSTGINPTLFTQGSGPGPITIVP